MYCSANSVHQWMIADSADRLSAGGCSRCRGAGLRHLIKKVKHDKDGNDDDGDDDDDKDRDEEEEVQIILKRSNLITMGELIDGGEEDKELDNILY